MKVYELMNLLENIPSGATVYFNTVISEKELKAGGVFDTGENGKPLYSVSGEIVDVSEEGSSVYLSD